MKRPSGAKVTKSKTTYPVTVWPPYSAVQGDESSLPTLLLFRILMLISRHGRLDDAVSTVLSAVFSRQHPSKMKQKDPTFVGYVDIEDGS